MILNGEVNITFVHTSLDIYFTTIVLEQLPLTIWQNTRALCFINEVLKALALNVTVSLAHCLKSILHRKTILHRGMQNKKVSQCNNQIKQCKNVVKSRCAVQMNLDKMIV